jgi:hypothetical protein
LILVARFLGIHAGAPSAAYERLKPLQSVLQTKLKPLQYIASQPAQEVRILSIA